MQFSNQQPFSQIRQNQNYGFSTPLMIQNQYFPHLPQISSSIIQSNQIAQNPTFHTEEFNHSNGSELN
jgi:hypothetical protein